MYEVHQKEKLGKLEHTYIFINFLTKYQKFQSQTNNKTYKY